MRVLNNVPRLVLIALAVLPNYGAFASNNEPDAGPVIANQLDSNIILRLLLERVDADAVIAAPDATRKEGLQAAVGDRDSAWDDTCTTLYLRIPLALIRSFPFKAGCVLASLLLFWVVYALRIVAIANRRRIDAAARLSERERMARELHDTLLQGFQGLMLRLQAAADRAKSEPERAHELIEQTLARADAVLDQGRDIVENLRTSHAKAIDLPQFFRCVVEDGPPQMAKVCVAVEGVVRQLRPAVLEEIKKIGAEAITNALRHAQASAVEVGILFEHRRFALWVSDNGIGIDAAIVHGGRDRHFGLMGMRERAKQINGIISIASRSNSGTDIEVTVPARSAYVPRRAGNARLWLRRMVVRGS